MAQRLAAELMRRSLQFSSVTANLFTVVSSLCGEYAKMHKVTRKSCFDLKTSDSPGLVSCIKDLRTI